MTRTASPAAALLALAMVFTLWLPTLAAPARAAAPAVIAQVA